MKAGRELDALVAKELMRLDVLGWAICVIDPECCIPWHGSVDYDQSREADRVHGRYKWPIYLAHCSCEFREPDDADIFGHTAYCFEPVPMYSTNILAAWDIAEKIGLMVIPVAVYPDEESWEANLKEKADTWWLAVPSDYDVYLPLESYRIELGSLEWVEERIPIYALAETAPRAICLASLHTVGYNVEDTS